MELETRIIEERLFIEGDIFAMSPDGEPINLSVGKITVGADRATASGRGMFVPGDWRIQGTLTIRSEETK